MPSGLAVGVALLRDGDLGLIAAPWRGWCLRAGTLYTPEGWGFTPGEVCAIPLREQQLLELRRRDALPRQFALIA